MKIASITRHGLLAVRLILSALFVWAGLLKLSHPRAFAHVLDEYGIFSGWGLVIASFAIPALEVAAGGLTLFGRRAGYALMLGMLVVFTIVIGYALAVDLDVDCGCFSLEERRGRANLQIAFVRDVAMMAGAMWLLLRNRGGITSAPIDPPVWRDSTNEGGTER